MDAPARYERHGRAVLIARVDPTAHDGNTYELTVNARGDELWRTRCTVSRNAMAVLGGDEAEAHRACIRRLSGAIDAATGGSEPPCPVVVTADEVLEAKGSRP